MWAASLMCSFVGMMDGTYSLHVIDQVTSRPQVVDLGLFRWFLDLSGFAMLAKCSAVTRRPRQCENDRKDVLSWWWLREQRRGRLLVTWCTAAPTTTLVTNWAKRHLIVLFVSNWPLLCLCSRSSIDCSACY